MRNDKTIYTIGIAGIIFFLTALILVLSGHASSIDDPIRYAFYSMRHDGLNDVISIFTLAGNWQAIVAVCIIFLVIPYTRKSIGLPLSIGNTFVALTNNAIKHIIQRVRPDIALFLISEDGFSFPSGHSISSMYTYGLLLYFVLTKVKNTAWKIVLTIVLTVLTFGIGLSRIFVGVHYPTDVLAGWSLGALAVMVTVWILQKLESSANKDEPTHL